MKGSQKQTAVRLWTSGKVCEWEKDAGKLQGAILDGANSSSSNTRLYTWLLTPAVNRAGPTEHNSMKHLSTPHLYRCPQYISDLSTYHSSYQCQHPTHLLVLLNHCQPCQSHLHPSALPSAHIYRTSDLIRKWVISLSVWPLFWLFLG